MKKFLSILLVLMLAVLPAMAEGIQGERQISTVVMTSPMIEGLNFKVVVDEQIGEYPHVLEHIYLNGEEILAEGAMVDEFAGQLFVSLPMFCENVMVFDNDDLNKVINVLGNAIFAAAEQLMNDPEFVAGLEELAVLLEQAADEAMVKMSAEQAEREALVALLASLNYDNLAKELEAIFTPAQRTYTSEAGIEVTEYSITVNQEMADKFIAAIAAFFAENKEALGEYAVDEATVAQFKALTDELMSKIAVSGAVGLDANGNIIYVNVDVNIAEEGDVISISCALADVKQGENESAMLSYDIKVNGESAGIHATVEAKGDTAVIKVFMTVEEAVIDLLRLDVTIEKAEPTIAYVNGGETVSPLKLSSEEFGKFLQDAAARCEAYSNQLSEKIGAIVAALMPAEEIPQ